MKFSVVIPMYNKQHTIRRAVYSVFDQLEELASEVQLVIVDDGSTDNSLSIVNRIQTENAHRDIIVYSQKNAGVSVARNKGIMLASHNFIAFLDADDSYEPNFLEEINKLIISYPSAGLYCTSYRIINTYNGTKRNAKLAGLRPAKNHQLLDSFFDSAATGDLPVTSSSVCIKRSALIEIGGFPVGEHMGEDQAVWSQLALTRQIAISKKIGANYFEDNSDSLMQTIAPSGEMPFSQRLQKQLSNGLIPTKEIAPVRQYIAGHLLDLIRRNIKSGDLTTAKKLLRDHRARAQTSRWVFWSLLLRIKLVRERMGKNMRLYSQ